MMVKLGLDERSIYILPVHLGQNTILRLIVVVTMTIMNRFTVLHDQLFYLLTHFL